MPLRNPGPQLRRGIWLLLIVSPARRKTTPAQQGQQHSAVASRTMAVWVTFSEPMRLQHGECVILIGVYVSKISWLPLHVSMALAAAAAVAFAIIAKRLKAIDAFEPIYTCPYICKHIIMTSEGWLQSFAENGNSSWLNDP